MPAIFFFSQQSNSIGVALNTTIDPSLNTALDGCLFWDGTSFTTLSPTNCQYPPRTSTEHGAILSLMKRYHETTGEICYGIMYSIAGIGLFNTGTITTFYPSTRGTYFDKGLSTFNSALAYLWNVLNIRENYKFIYVPQGGESDAGNSTNANAYEVNLTNYLIGWITNLNGTAYEHSKKYVIIPLNSPPQALAFLSTVQTAMNNVAAAGIPGINAIVTINQDTFDWAGLHHTALGYKQEGEGIYNLILSNAY